MGFFFHLGGNLTSALWSHTSRQQQWWPWVDWQYWWVRIAAWREGGREGGIGFLGCSQKHTRSLREGWELMRYQQYSLLLSVLSSGVWSLTSLIKLCGPAMNWNSSSGNDKDNWWQWHSQVDTKEELKCEASWFVYRKAIIYMRSWEVETKGVISCYPLWIQ